jgi:hypothetical protein
MRGRKKRGAEAMVDKENCAGANENVIEQSAEDLASLRVVDLRAKLKLAGLPVSGRKVELVARLQTFYLKNTPETEDGPEQEQEQEQERTLTPRVVNRSCFTRIGASASDVYAKSSRWSSWRIAGGRRSRRKRSGGRCTWRMWTARSGERLTVIRTRWRDLSA